MNQLPKPLEELIQTLEQSGHLKHFDSKSIPFHLRDSISFHELPLWDSILRHMECQERTIKSIEALRPMWAQGHTDDSTAAQVSSAALSDIWSLLGADSQTEAMLKLKALLGDDQSSQNKSILIK